jgi:two-component system phosphate regulon sensor histidine kinase PhoR
MFSSRLFWKLFVTYASLSIAWAAVFAVIVSKWYERRVNQQIEQRLSNVATLVTTQVADRLGRGRSVELQSVVREMGTGTGIRITVVAMDGRVLADSERESLAEVALMDNHRDRHELRQAGRERVGKARRVSPTLGVPMLYLARQVEREGRPVGLVRVAIPLDFIRDEVAKIQRLIGMLAILVGISVIVLTYWISTRIIRPINRLTLAAQAVADGDFDQRVKLSQHDELSQLADAFTLMSQQLAMQVGQLRASSERLSTVLGGMAEGVVAVDDRLRILFANATAGRLLGFSASQAKGRRLLEMIRHHVLYDVAVNTLKSSAPLQCEIESDGSGQRTLEVYGSPLPGQPCPGAVLVLRDITELRRLESLRRDFVANVSHELKTPLSSIKAYAETLSHGAIEDADIRLQFVHQIEEQAERLHQLILDVLSLARIESGKQAFDIKPVAVAHVVQLCLEQQRGNAEAKGISLESQPHGQAVHVRADEEGVRQILDNLVDNAIKYTPQGGRVLVRWTVENSLAVIQVQDNGIGIDPKHQPRIFERFFRVDVARSRELGGTGLGLSIVKHLAQFFGGSVAVASQRGAGSTFVVRLPVA